MLESPAARKGKWLHLQRSKPSYAKLATYLTKNEWGTDEYETKYWADIYGCEDPTVVAEAEKAAARAALLS